MRRMRTPSDRTKPLVGFHEMAPAANKGKEARRKTKMEQTIEASINQPSNSGGMPEVVAVLVQMLLSVCFVSGQ